MADVNIRLTIGITTFHIISLAIGQIGQIPMHIHGRNSYELHYISSGKGLLRTEEQNYSLAPGHFYLSGPELAHEQIADPENPMCEYCIYYTTHQKSTSEKENDPLALILLSQDFWFGTIAPSTQAALLRLFQEDSLQLPHYEHTLRFIAGELFVQLAREYCRSKPLSSPEPKLNTEDKKFLIIEREFLGNYINVTPQSLASMIGLSTRQLQRLIKTHYNMTFQQMRIKARLNAACILLSKSTLSITAVAEQTGFLSVEYFGNCFRREYHMTAWEYRKKIVSK